VPSLRQVLQRDRALLTRSALAGLVRTLRTHDLALGVPTGRDAAADLIARNGHLLVLGRVVTTTRNGPPQEALDAVGPLTWQGWNLAERAAELQLEPHLWFACTKAPGGDAVRFLEAHDYSVSWVDRDRMEFGPRTRLRWQPGAADESLAWGA